MGVQMMLLAAMLAGDVEPLLPDSDPLPELMPPRPRERVRKAAPATPPPPPEPTFLDDVGGAVKLWGPRAALVGAMVGSAPLLMVPGVGTFAAGVAGGALAMLHETVAGNLNVGHVDEPVAVTAGIVAPQVGGVVALTVLTLGAAVCSGLTVAAMVPAVPYDVSTSILWVGWGALIAAALMSLALVVTTQVVTALVVLGMRREHVMRTIKAIRQQREGA